MINYFIKIMAKNEKNEKGFTLVELMVVVAIIGVLTAIAVPVYNNSQRKARFNAHLANVRILQGAAVQAVALEGNPDEDIEWDKDNNKDEKGKGYQWSVYLLEWPSNPYKSEDYYSVEIATDGQITIYVGGDKEKVVTPNQTEEDYKNLKKPTQNES